MTVMIMQLVPTLLVDITVFAILVLMDSKTERLALRMVRAMSFHRLYNLGKQIKHFLLLIIITECNIKIFPCSIIIVVASYFIHINFECSL